MPLHSLQLRFFRQQKRRKELVPFSLERRTTAYLNSGFRATAFFFFVVACFTCTPDSIKLDNWGTWAQMLALGFDC